MTDDVIHEFFTSAIILCELSFNGFISNASPIFADRAHLKKGVPSQGLSECVPIYKHVCISSARVSKGWGWVVGGRTKEKALTDFA